MLPPLFQFGEGTFKDTGCFDGEFPSCLKCPLIECKYDVPDRPPTGAAGYRERHPEAVKLTEMGMHPKVVARMTGMSESNARRIGHAIGKPWKRGMK